MNLKELKTTPLPWSVEIGEQCCFHKGNRVGIVRWSKDGPEEDNCETVAEVWPTCNDSDIADGKFIVHCVNNFAHLVEALEDAREFIMDHSDESDGTTNPEHIAASKRISDILDRVETIPSGEKGDK